MHANQDFMQCLAGSNCLINVCDDDHTIPLQDDKNLQSRLFISIIWLICEFTGLGIEEEI